MNRSCLLEIVLLTGGVLGCGGGVVQRRPIDHSSDDIEGTRSS